MKKIIVTMLFSLCLTLSGCNTLHNDVVGASQFQDEEENYMYRTFATADKNLVMRAVIATMQDLGVIIEKASEKTGSIKGIYMPGRRIFNITVLVRVVKDKEVSVKVVNKFKGRDFEHPVPYRNFFAALEKNLNLKAK